MAGALEIDNDHIKHKIIAVVLAPAQTVARYFTITYWVTTLCKNWYANWLLHKIQFALFTRFIPHTLNNNKKKSIHNFQLITWVVALSCHQ